MRKYLLRYYLLIFILLTAFVLTSCDSGLKIIKIEVTKYPKNIVYVIGEDNGLNLTGGLVKLITSSGKTTDVVMNDDRELQISSNANFKQPGVYVVTVSRTSDVYCQFPIQVVRSCERDLD